MRHSRPRVLRQSAEPWRWAMRKKSSAKAELFGGGLALQGSAQFETESQIGSIFVAARPF